jgi:hypothetical protein
MWTVTVDCGLYALSTKYYELYRSIVYWSTTLERVAVLLYGIEWSEATTVKRPRIRSSSDRSYRVDIQRSRTVWSYGEALIMP